MPTITPTGGIVVGSTGQIVPQTETICPCIAFPFFPSGGVVVGGSLGAASPIRVPSGGVVVGGSNLTLTSTADPFFQVAAAYLLNGTYNGTTGEVKDSTRNAFNGTGGNGIAANTPTATTGVFCRGSQAFDGAQLINLPFDSLATTTPITVTAWVNIQEWFNPRTIYSRGLASTVLNFGYNSVRQVFASVVGASGSFYAVAGRTQLNYGAWYHVACVLSPGSDLSVFVNGVLDNSNTFTEQSTATATDGNYIARMGTAGYPTAEIQDVRVYPTAKSQPWLQAEHDNLCVNGFYAIGLETTV